MKKYLAYFDTGIPANIAELTSEENWPFVGYSKTLGVEYTEILPPSNEIWYTLVEGGEDFPIRVNTANWDVQLLEDRRNGLQGVLVFDKPLTNVGASAFANASLVASITLPKGITSIDTYAFQACPFLLKVSLPSTLLSVKQQAFLGNQNLKHVHIPKSVSLIESMVFSNSMSNGDTYVTVHADNPKYDSRNNCNAIIETATNKLIAGFNNTVIPEDVTVIGEWAFNGRQGIESIVIPESVTTLEWAAFSTCTELKSVVLGGSISNIGNGAFQQCSALSDITYNSTMEQWEAIYKYTGWNSGCPAITVHCTDGDVFIPSTESGDNL